MDIASFPWEHILTSLPRISILHGYCTTQLQDLCSRVHKIYIFRDPIHTFGA